VPWPPGIQHVNLAYARDSPALGKALTLWLTVYRRADWEGGGRAAHEPTDPCWAREEVMFPHGRAALWSWPTPHPPRPGACPPDRPPEHFLAHVDLGEAVVVVEPAHGVNPPSEGLEAVVRALVRAR